MDLWQQVQQLFDAALQHSPEKRQEFLEQEGGSNQELRREVESLLAAHDESGSFMAEPALVENAEPSDWTTDPPQLKFTDYRNRQVCGATGPDRQAPVHQLGALSQAV